MGESFKPSIRSTHSTAWEVAVSSSQQHSHAPKRTQGPSHIILRKWTTLTQQSRHKFYDLYANKNVNHRYIQVEVFYSKYNNSKGFFSQLANNAFQCMRSKHNRLLCSPSGMLCDNTIRRSIDASHANTNSSFQSKFTNICIETKQEAVLSLQIISSPLPGYTDFLNRL